MTTKPSTKEEEYMMQLELERRQRVEQEAAARLAEDERRLRKDLHWMHCPKCGQELQEDEHLGVRLDRCPHCQGLWLDAGELDQLRRVDVPGGILGRLGTLFSR